MKILKTKTLGFAYIVSSVLSLPFIPHVDVELKNGDVVTGLRKLGVESFRGIPYAEPPINDLRFKPSIPYSKSIDGLEALDFGDTCYQVNPLGIWDYMRKVGAHTEWITPSLIDGLKSSKMSEDCLTLNIYRPPHLPPGQRVPVLVWTYGGAFQFGSTTLYPGGRYVRDSVKMDQPVIFVSYNYRAGPWGFLGGSAIDAENSTNAAVWDSINAFRWIKKNIASFGGDPERITAFGTSTGAQLLSHTMLTKVFRKESLFNSVILQSGSVLPFGPANGFATERQFWTFANASGCPTNIPATKALNCLRSKPADELYQAQTYDNDLSNSFDLAAAFSIWSPRQDGRMWNANPYEIVVNGHTPDIPMIIGQQEDEGTLVSILFATKEKEETDKKLRTLFPFGGQNFTNYIDLYSSDPAEGAPFRTGEKNQLYPDFKRSSAILTDIFYTIPRRLILENTDCNSSPRYVYYSTAFHNKIPYFGSTQMTDVIWQFYLFRNYASNAFRRYFISFANNHNPNINTNLVEWPEWTTEEQQVLHIERKNGSIIVDDFRLEQSGYAISHYKIFNTL
ncbi:uncharacterized protein SAPINGB_P004787 [Magnusiomyces paraingens]|uniref:Carboxylesterase type B domain-containing protein n=1 Tax=Magnusiomyces paraingens TaxID=2606893 RepID=A0A5E8C4K9_9ASCO|nr:uncharacterized protein SAPINGB_P004787 [Saprochaete ingens]VVT56076.1 unnamed protein product [Saprochaete ingens]